MKKIIFLLLFLSTFCSFASAINKTVKMRHAETKQFVCQMKDKKALLLVKWTLYKNKGLVLVVKYDGFAHQNILYTDFGRNSFSLPLAFRDKSVALTPPSLTIYFKKYDEKSNQAILELSTQGNVSLSEKFIQDENLEKEKKDDGK